ncbi:MAG TPA: hypothetical protein VK050_00045 [Flavobacteriaceae bacterium]|nr:hypothetical protein [Flavobacteriaceae bacterium]
MNLKIKAETERTIKEIKEYDFERIVVSFRSLKAYDKDGKEYYLNNVSRGGYFDTITITKDGVQYPKLKIDKYPKFD